MAQITQERFGQLLQKAPQGTTEESLRTALERRGHTIAKPKGAFLDKASNVLDAIFGGGKVGEAIGASIARHNLPADQRQFVTSPSAKEVAGDVAGIGLTLGTLGLPAGIAGRVGLPAVRGLTQGSSLAGRVAEGVATGAGLAEAGRLKQGEDPNLEAALVGGTIGGAIPLAGAGLQRLAERAAETLPQRFAASSLKLTPREFDTPEGQRAVKQLLTKNVGTTRTLIADSQVALDKLDDQIETTLAGMPTKALLKRGDVLQAVTKSNPDFAQAQLTTKDILATIRAAVPKSANLLSKKTLTLQEANKLRQYLDRSLGKTFFQRIALSGKDPALTQEIVNAYSRNLSNVVKAQAGLEAQFAEYSKEIAMFKALKTLQSRQAGKDIVSMMDILSGIGGFAFSGGNPVAAALGLGARRGIQSMPTLQVLSKTAGSLPGIVTGGTGNATRLGLFQALKKAYEQ